ncbi:MAG: MauE/DoxX family redox-associated membrane protein [Candidatus Hydrothermales bacterium]
MTGKERIIPLREIFKKHNLYLLILLEIFLGLLFVYSGYIKLKNIHEFALTVAKYGILPSYFINLFSLTVPFLELFSGIFLIFGILKKGAYLVLIKLIFIFTLAITYAFVSGRIFECGCFEIFGKEEEIGIYSIFRNLIIFLLLLYGIRFRKK